MLFKERKLNEKRYKNLQKKLYTKIYPYDIDRVARPLKSPATPPLYCQTQTSSAIFNFYQENSRTFISFKNRSDPLENTCISLETQSSVNQ